MGKGDKKSTKGKRWRGSFGVSRNKQAIKASMKRAARNKSTVVATATPEVAAKPKRAPKKKAEA